MNELLLFLFYKLYKYMKILISIPPGNNSSPNTIVDELCSTENLGILRGKVYLYDVAWDKMILKLVLSTARELVCGDIIQFYDPNINNMIKGRVVSWTNECSINSEGLLSYNQSIFIEREIL